MKIGNAKRERVRNRPCFRFGDLLSYRDRTEKKLDRKRIQNWQDFFVKLDERKERGVFFYRISGYNGQVQELLEQYDRVAQYNGVVLERKIPNPDEKKLSYYQEIMGLDFQMQIGFFSSALEKWLPRVKEKQRKEMAAALYQSLDYFRRNGKNENMLKNAYIKYMCWLYYYFERIINHLGENDVAKILYEGEIGNYELMMLVILSCVGCDVILLQYKGEQSYRTVDPESRWSDRLELDGMVSFPDRFSIQQVRENRKNKENRVEESNIYGKKPELSPCTNIWMKEKGFSSIQIEGAKRGENPKLFYNCLIRINGVEDKLTYQNELYQFQLELKSKKRKVVIIEEKIPLPTVEEIAAVQKKDYNRLEQMLADLANQNIRYTANIELQQVIRTAFFDLLLEEGRRENSNINRLKNRAVYLLCWLKRYQPELFFDWKMPQIGCFIYLDGCQNENEAMFCRFLSRLPVDVLILVPDQKKRCILQDSNLYEINYEDTLEVLQFPREDTKIHLATAAYHAERELDTLMYQNSGIYRNQQYHRAAAVTLQTMYEEIQILWGQELKYRPNFSIVNNFVNLPVLFAKVSGVKNGNLLDYWLEIKSLLTEDVLLIKKVPYIKATDENPIKRYAAEFFKNKKLQRTKIKSHPSYSYGFLREEMQEYILDKLQLLIEQKTIKGTFENGTEYTILSTVLNMNQDLLRMIQKFDFTKKNPKIVHINTTEEMVSLEDAILMAFLNLIGFDIVLFVPTGYQSIEKYFQQVLLEEYQAGEYLYDLEVPDFEHLQEKRHWTWRDKIFKRGH